MVNSGLAMAGWLDANGLNRGDGGKGTYGSTKQIVDACGPNVLYETPAKRLVVDPLTHEVFGVIAEDAQGNEVAVKANKGVLLASGGFLGNEELVHRFVVPREVGMLNQGAPTCTGDGLLMAVSAGAALKNLNWMCLELNGQASIAYTKASEEIGTAILHTAMDSDKAGARIIVNQKGQRFMDEDKEFIHTKCNYAPFDYSGGFMAYEGFANLPMYLIFDSQLMDNVRLGNGGMLNTIGWAYAKDLYTWSEDNKAELERGWFVQADTIEELVEKLAEQSGNDPIDAEVLKQTIETYNGYCADGVDADFHRAEKPNMHYGEPALVALARAPVLCVPGLSLRHLYHRWPALGPRRRHPRLGRQPHPRPLPRRRRGPVLRDLGRGYRRLHGHGHCGLPHHLRPAEPRDSGRGYHGDRASFGRPDSRRYHRVKGLCSGKY